MKEIKAYVRASMANHVIEALTQADPLDFSILTVRGLSQGLSRDSYQFSVQLGEIFQDVVKIELVCRDENAARLAEIIQKAASTGRKGDGIVFIGPIDEGIRISSGERGEQVLPA
jgi:nitrogen regulatory protein PII